MLFIDQEESYKADYIGVRGFHYQWLSCDAETNADRCAELVLQGEKRATASLLLWAYETDDEPLPTIGQLAVVTNWAGIPQCIIQITTVDIRPFDEVDAAFAREEGEGDTSLDFWRKEHWKVFSEECQELGKTPYAKMPVILERFKVVFREKYLAQ